jgi:hypothetical protein
MVTDARRDIHAFIQVGGMWVHWWNTANPLCTGQVYRRHIGEQGREPTDACDQQRVPGVEKIPLLREQPVRNR